ncbi:MAG: ABC transporter permease [Pyrinomonadaceae bacterium]|jgi:putative ABC transport system permease protein|nr:ABC transporter permease [Pyrinomonadaceae bacterium]
MLLKIVRKSLRQHALSTLVTAFAIALASGLVMSVFVIQTQTYQAFTGGNIGFDAVLGARGSQLQLVLNSVFHLETSNGNIPYAMYQDIAKNPQVQLAIPYAVGDNYQGFRIVGTTEEIFTKFEYRKGQKFEFEDGGRAFNPISKEAVIGSFAAKQTGLKIGDVIQPYHGFIFDEKQKHDDNYTVVGILKPTNTPSDRVVWLPIEGIYRMKGHILRGSGENFTAKEGETIPDEAKEISSVMLKFSSPQVGMQFDQMINKQGKVATLAFPIGRTMAELFDKVGWVVRILELVAYLVVIVAAFSILASIYNSINERRRDFAIMRALGAKRQTIFAVIILESAFTALIGAILGFLVYTIILSIAAYIVKNQTGVVINIFSFNWMLVLTPILMTIIGAISGLIPAFKAYQTDVAENLVPVS